MILRVISIALSNGDNNDIRKAPEQETISNISEKKSFSVQELFSRCKIFKKRRAAEI